MIQDRYYPTLNLRTAVERLERFFAAEEHEVQVLTGGEITVVQAKKESTLTTLTGLSSALTVRFVPEAGGVRVNIGMTKWVEKAAVGVVGVIAFLPLALTSAYGFYNQHKLVQDIWRMLDDLAGINTPSEAGWSNPAGYRPGAWSEDMTCASCGAGLPAGVGFCARCGANVQQPVSCSRCGVKGQPGARFCSGCGARLEGA